MNMNMEDFDEVIFDDDEFNDDEFDTPIREEVNEQ
jgi:hypothetical protein